MHKSPDFSFVPSSALLDKALDNAPFRTFSLICMHINRKHTGSFPSYSTLAAEQGTHRGNIIKYVNKLVHLGYLTKESRTRQDGSSTSNFYHLNFDFSTGIGDGVIDTPPLVVKDTPPSSSQYSPLENNNQLNTKRKNNTKKVSLQEWEKAEGCQLCVEQMMVWLKDNQFDPAKIRPVILEFREKCFAGGKQYADFTAAFKVWLREGWLTKKSADVKFTQVHHGDAKFHIQDRGGAI